MKILHLCIGLLLLCSCGPGSETDGYKSVEVKRIISNQSGENVRIITYLNVTQDNQSSEKQIGNGQKIEETAVFRIGYGASSELITEMETYLTVDSVTIILGEKRVLKFCNYNISNCAVSNRNIIFEYFHSGIFDGYIKSDTANETYIYTITEEDYLNAEPL